MKSSTNEQSALFEWYKHLHSRTVDLIGDYAGNELFLVDGDSLILHCLETNDIDLDNGFQTLHAVYCVESFLASLASRKANFNVVFFDTMARHCIPSQAAPDSYDKYHLLRTVVKRHLTCNLRNTHPEISVYHFASYKDPAFLDSCRERNVYFVMCHDGASPTFAAAELPEDAVVYVTKKTPLKPKEEQRDLAKEQTFRSMIYSFIVNGINIALMNSVKWQDTKISAMVQEGSRTVLGDLDTISMDPAAVDPAQSDIDYESILKGMDDIDSETILVAYTYLHMPGHANDQETLARAFVLTAFLSQILPLSRRRLPAAVINAEEKAFIDSFAIKAQAILSDGNWQRLVERRGTTCDIADVFDARLFAAVRQNMVAVEAGLMNSSLAPKIKSFYPQVDFDQNRSTASASHVDNHMHNEDSSNRFGTAMTVLPFQNPVFEEHLSSIKVEIAPGLEPTPRTNTAKTFQELTHWHNTKPVRTIGVTPLTEWQKGRALRTHQMFLRELQQYAASLTSAVGKSLDPEVIFVGKQNLPDQAKSLGTSANAAKVENAARLASKNDQRFTSAWQSQLKDLSKIQDIGERYIRAQAYLHSLPKDRSALLGPEVEVYMLDCLIQIWHGICENKQQSEPGSSRFAALIFDALNKKKTGSGITTKSIQVCLQTMNDSLGLPFRLPVPESDRALVFKPFLSKVDTSLKVPRSAMEFQLQHAGPYMDRSFDSMPDSRVRFEPDAWQRRVLDLIDEKKSVFVVAPTSAGKTFISFYAMSQVLRESDDGVLVYVAPTKALVNQIAAELQAQYTKTFKYPGKTVWAIHTRDYRVNDAQKCQILVTVPHVLQIMLMAPTHAKANGWATRVKRIIFDEVHSIGAAEDGVVWEQLLLLAPCPIVALSATVGNPEQFYEWMRSTQSARGLELEMVKHPYRYSDLRKFVYQAPAEFQFEPFAAADNVGLQSLDDAPGLTFMHPVASLANGSRGIPEDLHLEARDCLALYNSMKKASTAKYPLDAELDPATFLPAIIKKTDILAWETRIKDVLKAWMSDPVSPFQEVVADFSRPVLTHMHRDQQKDDLLTSTLPLLSSLQSRNALPAILFNYDRSMCEKIAQALMEQLTAAQAEYKANSPKWKAQLAKYEKWKKEQDKVKFKRPTVKKSKKGDNEDGGSKGEREREAAELEQNPLASFDPNGIVEGFSFANGKALLPSEFDALKKKLEWRHISAWLIEALRLGIGIHHAGMNRSYRQAVETLFRRGFLRVVIATGTLALGINMPCKTVVFSGDSIFLTALNYRQAAGRAGRRGFDILGNVVFHGISPDKAFRLVSSRLPDLNGHFPITTSLVLRLFTLLNDSGESVYAKDSIDSLLSQPRLYLGGNAFREQVLHHLRYSIEYLRRQHLIDHQGKAINFAGLVSHLYYVEQSSFAFHSLLKGGYFNKLCVDFTTNAKSRDRILDTLMLVMSHIFGRRPCRRADQEFVDEVVKKYSSYVFLPRLPEEAEDLLREHNDETLNVFSNYVKTFAEQHAETLGDDHSLPLTDVRFGGREELERSENLLAAIPSLPQTTVRSSFVALSGHGDKFKSISELCRTARQGVWLEEAVIPHLPLHPEEMSLPLNAYLYDFYRHGDLNSLENANGVRKGDVWFLLNDFSLVLATIVTSFKNYMKVNADADLDMADVLGAGDGIEVQEDDRVAGAEVDGGRSEQKPASGPSSVAAGPTTQVLPVIEKKKTKVKVADSWDDDAQSEEEDSKVATGDVQDDWDASSDSEEARSGTVTQASPVSTRATSALDSHTDSSPAWDADSGEGLKRVALAFEALKKNFDEKFRKIWA